MKTKLKLICYINLKKLFVNLRFVSNLLSKTSNEIIDDRFLSHDVTTLCIDDAKKSLNRILLVTYYILIKKSAL